MNIIGEKVMLRAIEDKDADVLRDMINDPEMEFLLGGWSFPVSVRQQLAWQSGLGGDTRTLRCVIETIEGKDAIGTVVLSDIDAKNGNAEIHIKIRDGASRGQGFGSDAIRALIRYAFDELRLECVFARVSEHNEVSLRLFTKCGFVREGILRRRLFKRGRYVDVVVLSILRSLPSK
jgi:RimJ/RimL family protein N-acetyltransferase